MKKLLSIVCFLLAMPAFAQISADSSQKEQQKIISLSAYQTIDYFSTARELKIPARKGDVIVLQDEERRLYFGIIDSVKSLNSIQVVLYPKANKRELVQATYDDLYYLKNRPAPKADNPSAGRVENAPVFGSSSIVDKTVGEAVEKAVQKALSGNLKNTGQPDPELETRIEKLEKKIESQELRINQAAFNFERAGKSYETAETLRIVSFASLFLGIQLLSSAAINGSTTNLAAGSGFLILTSGITGIGAVVYRFKGHSKLKTAGAYLRN